MLPIASVKDFGARGDGIADDTAAVNAALRRVAGGGTLLFPSGVYQLSNIRLENVTNLDIAGSAATIRWLGKAPPGRNIGFELAGACTHVVIHDLSIVGDGSVDDGHAAVWAASGQSLRDITVRDCRISNVVVGISFNADLSGTFVGGEIRNNHLEDIVGTEPGHGYGIHIAVDGERATHIRVIDNTIVRAHRHSIYQARGVGVVIARNTIRDHRRGDEAGPYRSAIAIARSSDCTLSANVIENSVGEAIGIDQAEPERPTPTHDITIADNVILNTQGLDLRIGSERAQPGNVPTRVTVKGNRFSHPSAVIEASALINSGAHLEISDNEWQVVGAPRGYRVIAVQSDRPGVLTDLSIHGNRVSFSQSAGADLSFVERRAHGCDEGFGLHVEGNRVDGLENKAAAAVRSNCDARK